MANMPHPDLRQLNHRIPGDLAAAVKAAAQRNGETEKAFVIRALEREIARHVENDRRGAEIADLRAQLAQDGEIMRDLGGQAREAEQAAYDAWQAGR